MCGMDDLEKENRELRLLNQNLTDLLDKIQREENEKKNHNFVQLYHDSINSFRRLMADQPSAAEILLIMVQKMDKQNALILSQKNLQKLSGKSRTCVNRAIAALKERRFIELIKVGTSNAYIINSAVFWQNSAQGRFACFDAKVYASLDEQEKGYKEKKGKYALRKIPLTIDEEIPCISLKLEEALQECDKTDIA